MELPTDVVGVVFNATDDIRAAACVNTAWAEIGRRHPDMAFWRARSEIWAAHLINVKLRRAVKSMGLRRVVSERRYHLIRVFSYNPVSLMVCLDFNDREQIKNVRLHVDEPTHIQISTHAALLKSPMCTCAMCNMTAGPIMW